MQIRLAILAGCDQLKRRPQPILPQELMSSPNGRMPHRVMIALAVVSACVIGSTACQPPQPTPGDGSHGPERVAEGDALRVSRAATEPMRVSLGSPAILYVLRAEDCYSCLSFAPDFKMSRRLFPGARVLMIGVGDSIELTRYFRRNNVIGILDHTGTITSGLNLRSSAVLVVDTRGLVLYRLNYPTDGPPDRDASQVLASLTLTLSGNAISMDSLSTFLQGGK